MPERPQGSAQSKVAELRRRQRAAQMRGRALIGAVILAVLAAIAVALVSLNQPRTVKAAVRGMAEGATVDHVACDSDEQIAYHIHAHLAIFVNDKPETVPAGIGIAAPQQVQGGSVVGGKCFYWLHTHDTSGVIHVESPSQRVYSLGQFFDIWGQPLSTSQVGDATGAVTAFVNGRRYSGDPGSIKLEPHAVIQIDLGTVVPAKPFTFTAGL